jgi:hypothetical protein
MTVCSRRQQLLAEWTGELAAAGVPASAHTSLIKTLQDPVKVGPVGEVMALGWALGQLAAAATLTRRRLACLSTRRPGSHSQDLNCCA